MSRKEFARRLREARKLFTPREHAEIARRIEDYRKRNRSDARWCVNEAAGETHLSKAAVIRAALRIGVPEVVKRLKAKKPRRPLTKYIDAFAGLLPKRNRELVKPSRFK